MLKILNLDMNDELGARTAKKLFGAAAEYARQGDLSILWVITKVALDSTGDINTALSIFFETQTAVRSELKIWLDTLTMTSNEDLDRLARDGMLSAIAILDTETRECMQSITAGKTLRNCPCEHCKAYNQELNKLIKEELNSTEQFKNCQ